jgi:hypothetical protein
MTNKTLLDDDCSDRGNYQEVNATKYGGMTVNERLYVSGLIDLFDKAVKEKNVPVIISILKKVELNDESITPIIDDLWK